MSQKSPNFYDPQARLEDLDKYKIDLEVTMITPSLDPNTFPLKKEELHMACRGMNNALADLMNKSRDRIISLAAVPLSSSIGQRKEGGKAAEEISQEGDFPDEMNRAIRELGMKGFMIPTNVLGVPLDKFETFWEQAAKLNVPVYLHPNDPVRIDGRPYEKEYDLMTIFGWPFETTLALSRLILSGIMEKYPSLKIMAHHMGGMIPFFAERINEDLKRKNIPAATGGSSSQAQARPTQKLIDQFKAFYFDTAVSGSSAAVRLGCDVLGIDRLLFATDYPFGPESGRFRLERYPSSVLALNLPKEKEEAILGANALKLFDLN